MNRRNRTSDNIAAGSITTGNSTAADAPDHGPKSSGDFLELGPDRVLTAVEKATGMACSNLFRPLNSYINRVFELQTRDGQPLIAKFYRPGRWSEQALLDEHRFLLELNEQEVPVIAPLTLQDGKTLSRDRGLHFAVFPKCGGRSVDEFNEDQWLQLGRLIGRMHQIGGLHEAAARPVMTPLRSGTDQLEYLLASSVVPDDLKKPLEEAGRGIIESTAPLFAGQKLIRIHGDCHFSNLIHRPGESLYIIDFDDMAMGVPVQDVWMLLPGPVDEALYELDLFLEGYETFVDFDRRSLKLIEPLRGLRFIHYMSWCARQVEGDGETRVVEGFGSREYWQAEIADLYDQRERIEKYQELSFGNML